MAAGDSEGLAREIAQLLLNDEDRMALAAEAQRRAVSENADVTGAGFRAVYARLAAKRGPL